MSHLTPTPSRRRRRLVVDAMSLALAAIVGISAATLAAGSPSEAVETLVDRIVTGGFDDLTGVVCPELEDDIRADLVPSASGTTFGAVQIDIADPVVTVVSEDAGSAVVNLSGTMHISFDEEQVREFIRAQLEAAGEDASDASVDSMMGLMASFVSEDLPIDEDLTVTESDGEWLVCDAGDSGGSFTDAGMCGLATPAELAELAPVPLVSNVGEGDYCQWIGADDVGYFSIDVGLLRDTSLDDFRGADPSAQELTVGGRPAIGSNGQLYVEVDGGVLSVLPYLLDSPDSTADPVAFAASVAELFLPRLDRLPVAEPNDLGPGPTGSNPLADCSIIDLEAVNAASVLTYDSVSGGDGTCAFVSSDLEAGTPFVSISLDPSSKVEDLTFLFPDGIEGDVDGHPSLGAVDTLWVQLDDGLLSVSPIFAASPHAADLDVYAYAADLARVVIEAIAGAG